MKRIKNIALSIQKRMQGRRLSDQLKCPSLLALLGLAVTVTGANAQWPHYSGPVGAVSQSTDKLDIFVCDANGFIQHGSWQPGGN